MIRLKDAIDPGTSKAEIEFFDHGVKITTSYRYYGSHPDYQSVLISWKDWERLVRAAERSRVEAVAS